MLLVLGLLSCASGNRPAALGWSLGGEAHVFVTGDRFARDLYRDLTGSGRLADSLRRRPRVSVAPRKAHRATVLSANGATPARLTLARFHAAETCGYPGIVTELVLAFPPGGGGGHSTPPSHVTVLALLEATFAGGAESSRPLVWTDARELVYQIAQRAERDTRGERLGLLHRPILDPDQAADAGEVVPVGNRWAVGFRATFSPGSAADTMLITGVALTDLGLHDVRWIVRPRRTRLTAGMIPGISTAVRYSVRGTVAGPRGGTFLLVDEFADVSARDSRATVVDPATGRVIAAQPLALRCP